MMQDTSTYSSDESKNKTVSDITERRDEKLQASSFLDQKKRNTVAGKNANQSLEREVLKNDLFHIKVSDA